VIARRSSGPVTSRARAQAEVHRFLEAEPEVGVRAQVREPVARLRAFAAHARGAGRAADDDAVVHAREPDLGGAVQARLRDEGDDVDGQVARERLLHLRRERARHARLPDFQPI
jgi:hypothetical protein